MRDESGMVTAELAVAIPVLVILVWWAAWAAILGITQLRMEDAARTMVRAAAIGVPRGDLEARLRTIDPRLSVDVDRSDSGPVASGQVQVVISRRLDGPGLVPAITLRASAIALVEP